MTPELQFEIAHARTQEHIDDILEILYKEQEEIEFIINQLLERSRKLES